MVLGALVVACTSTAEESWGSTPDGLSLPAPGSYRVLDDDDLMSPTVQLMGGGLRSDELLNDIERATAACMQVRGWTYQPVFITQPPEPLTVGEKRRQVTAYGFQMFSQAPSPPDTGTAASMRNIDRLQELGPEEQAQFLDDLDGAVGEGMPTADSCRGQAQAASGSPLFLPAFGAEMSELYQGAMSSPEGMAVTREYAECMVGRGYDVETPAAAYLHAQAVTEGLPIEEAIALEVRIATDDFECQLPTRMSWSHHVQNEIVRLLLERHPELAGD